MSKYFNFKSLLAVSAAATAIVAPTFAPVVDAAENYKLSLDARYDSGVINEDGGTTEIVAYNPHNHATYIVNGTTKKVEAISLNYDASNALSLKPFLSIDIAELLKTVDPSFEYGDLTSIAVHPTENVVVASVQAAGYNDPGYAVFLTGAGELLSTVKVGVQPDNITFTPDGAKTLTANEGEPRKGYGEGVVDPKGTVSVIDVSKGFENLKAEDVTFDKFDSEREQLVADGVILKKGIAPSVDLEPEYIAVSEDSKYAYVALQENNAIATIDLTSNEAISVKGLGFKDFNVPGNELDLRKDGKVQLQLENVHGIYMPDGIATYTVNGKTYIVTANEGDAREWGDEDSENFHLNEKEIEVDGSEIVFYDTTDYDGFKEGKDYIFGARSFSIVDAETMEVVYDSGSDFERITAEKFPEFFNASNDKAKLDNRSGKKGPEPEDVKVGKIGDEVFAFIGLERIGGVMMYNITDPNNVKFVDYLNLRDFSEDIKGDVSPEGLAFVAGDDPKLIVGHEVSGTVTVLNVLASQASVEEPDEEVQFEDIANHDAKNAIIAVTKAGLFKGVDKTTFAPNESFTRAQAATVLYRLAGSPDMNSNHTFIDVKSKDSHAQGILWAVENRLVAAEDIHMFSPYKPITREEFAVAVYNYLSQNGEVFDSVIQSQYEDDANIRDEAKNAVYALQTVGIMTGSDGKFNPNAPLTRAQAAIVFSKIIQ